MIGTFPFDDECLVESDKKKTILENVLGSGEGRRDIFTYNLSEENVLVIDSRIDVIRDDKGKNLYLVIISREVNEDNYNQDLVESLSTQLNRAEELGLLGRLEYDHKLDFLSYSDHFAEIYGIEKKHQ